VNILHKTLLSAVTMLSKVVETRATLPILSHIVLRQDGTRLHMAGTNMDLFLTLDVTPTTADPERLGDPIAVPAKDLLGVIKSLTDEIVSLKSYVNEEKVARLSVNGVTIEALPIEDFPSEPEPGQKTITLPNLMTAIARVLEVRSPDVSRYAITGIYVDAPQGSVVATDGHRLYGAVIAKAKGFEGILLGDFAKLLVIPTFRKFVTDTLHLDEKKGWHSVPIGSEGITGWFHSRVPEATFPNYEQVMPKDESAKATLTISTAALLAGVAKASALAEARNRAVELLIEDGRVQIAGSSERGNAKFDLPGATVTGENVIIGLNGRYLEHALKACTGATVTLLFNGWEKPMWFHDGEAPKKKMPATWTPTRLDVAIMPMRTRNHDRKAA
jgi:DNA polymerase III subunit beta